MIEDIEKDPSGMLDKTQKGFVPKETYKPQLLAQEHPFQSIMSYQDPPEVILGKRRSSRLITMDQKLEMWHDELIGFLMSYLATLLVGGEYDIICRDKDQQKFFQSVYASVHHDLMLKAAPALFFGFQALVKRFAFGLPSPVSIEDMDIGWDKRVEPYIIKDFLQIHPSRASVRWDDDGNFDGIEVVGLQKPVPVTHSMWITCGSWRAFGDYYGYGRSNSVFDAWHKKYFTMDQRTLYIQTGVAPPTLVWYPSGEQSDGTSNQSIAQRLSEKVSAGGSIAMPSDPYQGGPEFAEEYTNQKMWDIKYLINTADPGPFNEIKNDEDRRIALGMLVPPQTVMEAQQMGLGGPNTAEVMSELAERVLGQDALSIDTQINRHLFPFLVAQNYGPKAPPVYKVTKGLNAITRAHLQQVFMTMISSGQTNTSFIDLQTIANRVNVPTKPMEETPSVQAPDANQRALTDPESDINAQGSSESLDR